MNPMPTSTSKKKNTGKTKKKKSTKLPEQKLGDTPVAPWEMPTPKEKAKAKPIRRALKEAVAKVDSPKKAEKVIENLEATTSGQTEADVEQAQPSTTTTTKVARKVKKAAQTSTGTKKTEKVLKETARAIATPDKRQREIVSEAVQEVFNPEQQGAPLTVANVRQREYLRQAVLRRLKPLDALDANVFLAVNHLPHTPLLNKFFYGVTVAFNGAAAWYITMSLPVLLRRKPLREILWDVAVPLTVTGLLVEYPIKTYFKRRRPFIAIIQAVVIGKKPGTWSFPSGHSASAFAGAWLLNRKFPRLNPITYAIAGLVAFSRIYLGDHYPGDVTSGSLLGLLFARFFRRTFGIRRK
jgi:membrane-associated phospholipid phosphatase